MDESKQESFSFSGHSAAEEDARTPFDRFLKQPGVDMLQAALPYVSSAMRKPLALLMKFLEVNRIISDFDRDDVLTACGFESNPPNPEAMLRAMKMAGGSRANPQIDRILNMMNVIHSYQSFTDMMQRNPEMASVLTNLMNQSQRNGTAPSYQRAQANPQNPSQLFSQFAGKDPADLMSLLSQVSGKNPVELATLLSQLSGKNPAELSSVLSQAAGKDPSDLMAILAQFTGSESTDFSR